MPYGDFEFWNVNEESWNKINFLSTPVIIKLGILIENPNFFVKSIRGNHPSHFSLRERTKRRMAYRPRGN